ncbi:MAG TPA: CBS domain-containing protein [Actinomycetes bacterium]|nr:CBS domain-containing protein [Actinomycetes bacterium]
MRIADIMNRRAARIRSDATLESAAELLVLTQASVLAVVDARNEFVGVLSEGDLIRCMMPDLDEVLATGASLQDAHRAFLESGRGLAGQPIHRLVIEQPITVAPGDEILQAAAVMIGRSIRRLPVVDRGKFVGTVSRADVCWGLIRQGRGLGHGDDASRGEES